MTKRTVIPCWLCGYDAPQDACPHCRHAPLEPSLSPARRATSELAAGATALPRGLYFLASTPGAARWMLPPLVLALAFFFWAFTWIWGVLGDWIASLEAHAGSVESLRPEWFRDAIGWLVSAKAVWAFLHLGGLATAFLAVFLAGLYTFSLVYETLSGPFLDRAHARVESRWFGRDPRETFEVALPVSPWRALGLGLAVIASAGAIAWLGWRVDGAARWIVWIVGVPAPFVGLAVAQRGIARWASGFVGGELRMLVAGLQASALALVLLIAFLPLKLIPFVGWFLYGGAVGFSTSVSLFDIAMSRRNWSVATRLAFMRAHVGAALAFGATAGLLFLVPFLGPALCVPAASVGALWLICRVDKNHLRPLDRRRRAN